MKYLIAALMIFSISSVNAASSDSSFVKLKNNYLSYFVKLGNDCSNFTGDLKYGITGPTSYGMLACDKNKKWSIFQMLTPENLFYDTVSKKTWDGSAKWSAIKSYSAQVWGHTNGGMFGGGHSYCAPQGWHNISYGIRVNKQTKALEWSVTFDGVATPWKVGLINFSKFSIPISASTGNILAPVPAVSCRAYTRTFIAPPLTINGLRLY